MDKLKKICFTFLFIVIFLLALTIVVQAKSYNIDEMNIEGTIRSNGDLAIEQDITYNFEGSYNGIYLNIPYKIYDIEKNEVIKHGSINDDIYTGTGVEIESIEDGKSGTYSKVNKARNGDRNVYTLSNSDNMVNLKIYAPSTNEKRTFKIKYVIKNLCVKHEDIGELYYNFIGGEWDCDINNLNIRVAIPNNTNTLNIWGHGPIEGTSSITSKRLAEFNVPGVKKGQYVAVRIIFDKEVIKDSNKLSNIEAKGIIFDNEKDIFANKDIRNKFTIGVIIVSAVLLVYWIVLLLIFERENKYNIGDFDENELFNKYNPMLAGCIAGSRDILSRDIIAVILNLIEKKNIHLELKETTEDGNDYYRYYISEVPEKEKEMDEIEEYVYNWIFKFSRGKVDLQSRLEELGQEQDATIYFKELNTKVKKKLNSMGANESKVPLIIRMLNIGILIASILTIIAHIATNKFEVYINNLSMMQMLIILFGISIGMFVIYFIIGIISKIKHKVNRIVQKITGQKVLIKTLTIFTIFALIIILTAIFSPVKYIVADEVLLCIAIILVVTDNLMLKNNKEMEEDYNRLNEIKDKIEYYSLLNEKDIEYIKLWNKYLCYAVSFGISKKIIERIDGLYLDDEIKKLTQNKEFSDVLVNDYDMFYKYSNKLYRYFVRRSRHGMFDRFMDRTYYTYKPSKSGRNEFMKNSGSISDGIFGGSSSSGSSGTGGSFSGGGSFRGGGGRGGGGGAF